MHGGDSYGTGGLRCGEGRPIQARINHVHEHPVRVLLSQRPLNLWGRTLPFCERDNVNHIRIFGKLVVQPSNWLG
jgi:hypothetical protein